MSRGNKLYLLMQFLSITFVWQRSEFAPFCPINLSERLGDLIKTFEYDYENHNCRISLVPKVRIDWNLRLRAQPAALPVPSRGARPNTSRS